MSGTLEWDKYKEQETKKNKIKLLQLLIFILLVFLSCKFSLN